MTNSTKLEKKVQRGRAAFLAVRDDKTQPEHGEDFHAEIYDLIADLLHYSAAVQGKTNPVQNGLFEARMALSHFIVEQERSPEEEDALIDYHVMISASVLTKAWISETGVKANERS